MAIKLIIHLLTVKGSNCFRKQLQPSYQIDHSTCSNSSSIAPKLFFSNYYSIVHSNNSNQSSLISTRKYILTQLIIVFGSNFSRELFVPTTLITFINSLNFIPILKLIVVSCHLGLHCSITLFFLSLFSFKKSHCKHQYTLSPHHEIRLRYRLPSLFLDPNFNVRDILYPVY